MTYLKSNFEVVESLYWLTSIDPVMVKYFYPRDFIEKYSSNGNFVPQHWDYIRQCLNCLRSKVNLNLLIKKLVIYLNCIQVGI